jgi:predicted RNA-binding Zn ribbon-like protein
MADPIPLDPASYAGTYKLIGGAPALDFANLVSYRDTPRAHDWLDPPDNVHRWTRAAGLEARVSDRLETLIDLREALAQVFLALADGEDPRGPAFDVVAGAAHRARAQEQLTWDAGGAVWSLSKPSLADVLARDAALVLTDPSKRSRIGACTECRWIYLDTTRNRSRRWCDPADCGNRARQRRHYRRVH